MGSIIQNPLQLCLFQRSFAAQKKLHHHHLHHASRNRFHCNNIYKPSSFNYIGSVGVPLHELPGASFDQYIENKGRILRSIFPEKSSHQQLNEEEWKIKMNPIQALFLTFQPVAHITAKCISKADDYPPEIPCHITKFFEVQITRCEFPDLHIDYMPGNFNIKGRGALYLERQGKRNWMKNQLDIDLNITFPPLLASWVPQNLLQNIAQSVLNNYVEEINNGFAVRLLADYNSFKRNMLKAKYS